MKAEERAVIDAAKQYHASGDLSDYHTLMHSVEELLSAEEQDVYEAANGADR